MTKRIELKIDKDFVLTGTGANVLKQVLPVNLRQKSLVTVKKERKRIITASFPSFNFDDARISAWRRLKDCVS